MPRRQASHCERAPSRRPGAVGDREGRLGNMLLSTIRLEMIEGFQAKRKLVGTAIAGSTWTSARALRHAAVSRHRQLWLYGHCRRTSPWLRRYVGGLHQSRISVCGIRARRAAKQPTSPTRIAPGCRRALDARAPARPRLSDCDPRSAASNHSVLIRTCSSPGPRRQSDAPHLRG